MNHTHSQQDIPRAMRDISAALFALRDALLELSLALKDLQFETDREQRDKAAASCQTLLEKMHWTSRNAAPPSQRWTQTGRYIDASNNGHLKPKES